MPLLTTKAESLATEKPLHCGNHLCIYYAKVENLLNRIGRNFS